MKFNKEIRLSDLLTLVTIIVSVVALTVTWSKDRVTRETEQSDKVRSAAALALTKLDRWQLLNLSVYQKLQPVFVETSELLLEDFDIYKTRDHLWKKINEERVGVANKVLDEQIMTSYFDLLAHFPETRSRFVELFKSLRAIEDSVSTSFLAESEGNVLSLTGHQDTYTSATLGNALRRTALKHKGRFQQESNESIEPVRQFLFGVISKSNQEILMESRASSAL